MKPLRHIGLFEGIGGFSLAGHWAGWQTIAWCEWAAFPQKVLKHHFPNADQITDITNADFTIYRGKCDVLTGGFPCQPFSLAGSRKGADDHRYLWPHMLRAVQECRPTWVVGENVAGIASMAFEPRVVGVGGQTDIEGETVFEDVEQLGVLDSICADFEREGYDVQTFLIPACATNAPHRRDRIWIVAHCATRNERKTVGRRNEQTAFDGVTRYGSKELITNAKHNGLPTTEGRRSNGTDSQRCKEWPYCTKQFEGVCKPTKLGGLQQPTANPCGSRSQTNYVMREPARKVKFTGAYSKNIFTTNPESGGRGSLPNESQPPRPCQSSEPLECFCGMAVCRCNATNANGKRYEQCNASTEPSEQARQYSETDFGTEPQRWQNFPTQPPICGGNDGISDELDISALFEEKKAISKTAQNAYNYWRNESIKAYGNAIVPQVFYEIAKAINEAHQCD